MLTLKESTRNNPAKFVCSECQNEVQMVLHHDYMESYCCGKEYRIKVDSVGLWNCCSRPYNNLVK